MPIAPTISRGCKCQHPSDAACANSEIKVSQNMHVKGTSGSESCRHCSPRASLSTVELCKHFHGLVVHRSRLGQQTGVRHQHRPRAQQCTLQSSTGDSDRNKRRECLVLQSCLVLMREMCC